MTAKTHEAGAVILAAGGGRRFGGRKQLASLAGRPLLEHVVRVATAVATLDPIVVVLGAFCEEVRAGVDLGRAEAVECAAWEEGIASSLRCGVSSMQDAGVGTALILLGDQPGISPAAIEAVLDGLKGHQAARATFRSRPGHPVAVRSTLFPALAALEGDRGASALLEQVGVRTVECSHLASPDDVDVPADLRQTPPSSHSTAPEPH